MAISSSKDCPHCGSDHKAKPFAIYEDGYHCFSCGAHKRSIRNFTIKSLDSHEDIDLPQLTRNPSMFSLPILKWLRSYHITDDVIYKYYIAEAEGNSVITPVLQDNKVVMYQRRWCCSICNKMKCNCKIPRRIMTYGKKHQFIASSQGHCSTIVIVEDFISAIRVGENVDAYCMFGTSISYQSLVSLVKTYDTILIWADGDSPGQKAASKLIANIKNIISNEQRLRAFAYPFNKSIHNIVTELDPKCYTNTEIKQIIQQAEAVYDTKIKSSSQVLTR